MVWWLCFALHFIASPVLKPKGWVLYSVFYKFIVEKFCVTEFAEAEYTQHFIHRMSIVKRHHRFSDVDAFKCILRPYRGEGLLIRRSLDGLGTQFCLFLYSVIGSTLSQVQAVCAKLRELSDYSISRALHWTDKLPQLLYPSQPGQNVLAFYVCNLDGPHDCPDNISRRNWFYSVKQMHSYYVISRKDRYSTRPAKYLWTTLRYM